MTDKTKINEIDVSKCEFNQRRCRNTIRDTNICILTGVCTICENNEHCYYKQLQAKEQECEKLNFINRQLNIALGARRSAKNTFIQLANENAKLVEALKKVVDYKGEVRNGHNEKITHLHYFPNFAHAINEDKYISISIDYLLSGIKDIAKQALAKHSSL